MTKYYKVIKDTPLWEVGAILEMDKDGAFRGIEDIWDKHKDMTEYLSTSIVENSPEFFERVYRSEGEKLVFKTAEQLKGIYSKFISEDK